MREATARPWRVHVGGSEGAYIFPDRPDNKREAMKLIARIGGRDTVTDHKNAELIVRAVNSFDDLLAACKAALQMMDSMDRTDARCTTGFGHIERQLFDAIAKAEKP